MSIIEIHNFVEPDIKHGNRQSLIVYIATYSLVGPIMLNSDTKFTGNESESGLSWVHSFTQGSESEHQTCDVPFGFVDLRIIRIRFRWVFQGPNISKSGVYIEDKKKCKKDSMKDDCKNPTAMYNLKPVHVLSKKSTRQHLNVFICCTKSHRLALG